MKTVRKPVRRKSLTRFQFGSRELIEAVSNNDITTVNRLISEGANVKQ
jgi:hypothetical protein